MAKRKFSYITSVIVMANVLGACNSKELSEYQQDDVYSIQIHVADFEEVDALGRTSVSIDTEGAIFKWEENDTIGIFPNVGYQVAFPMESGAGSQHAEFTGGGWSLRSTYLYAAYYPFQFNNKSRDHVIVTYEGQEQDGNRSTKHIGAFDYMAAPASIAEEGKVTFDFKHLGALIQCKLNLPAAGNILSMSLVAEEDIFVKKGVVDLSKYRPKIQPLELDSCITLDLANIKTTKDDEEVVLYVMMAPIDLTGKTYTLQLVNEAGKMSTVKFKGQNFEAGKTYAVSAEMPIFESGLISVDEYRGVVVADERTQVELVSPFAGKSQCILTEEVRGWLSLRSGSSTYNGSFQLEVSANETDSTRRGIVWIQNLVTRQVVEFAILQSGKKGYAVTQTNGRIPVGVITTNCEEAQGSYGLSALVDKNLETYYEGKISKDFYLNWEGPYPITICSVEYGGGHDVERCPTNLSIHVATDGTDWHGFGWGVGSSDHFGKRLGTMTLQYKSRFFRLVVEKNKGGDTTQVSEFGLTIDTDLDL